MKLSIVIPAYNVESTLRKCVDSIVSQDYRDWQMIIVDDASTDESPAICNAYAKADGRIQAIHLKKNGGLSVARNTGVAKARGEYITFVDSDDYIAGGTLKKLMELLAVHPDYDILEYPVYEHFGGKGQRLLHLYKREYTDMKEYWLAGKAYSHTYAWNKIYRRELFSDVKFPPGKTFEDVWTLPQLLKHCNIVATTDVGLYYYCENPKGITQKATVSDLSSLLDAQLAVLKELQPAPNRRNFKKRLEADFAGYYAAVLNICLDVSDSSGSLPEASFPVLPYRHTLKLKLLHILGLKTLCRLHRIFRHSH